MAHLVKCIVCGGSVSSDAEHCIHCGSTSFRRWGTIEKYRYLDVKILGKCKFCHGAGEISEKEEVRCRNDEYAVGSRYRTIKAKCITCGGTGTNIWTKIKYPDGQIYETGYYHRNIKIEYINGKKTLVQPYPGYIVYGSGYID